VQTSIYTKVSVFQIGADGRRSPIFLSLSTAAEFRDHLSTFSDFYASLGPPNPENVPEDGKLKSEMMIKDNRRYYLDLKENSRGRFLRVSVSAMNIYCFYFKFINVKEYRILNYFSGT
jgi:hypothetical protein